MNLQNHYFKVEMKIFFKDHNHIEKDFFTTLKEAEDCFSSQFKSLEYGFLQNRINHYSLVLAEVFTDEQRTVIHKTRKAPL